MVLIYSYDLINSDQIQNDKPKIMKFPDLYSRTDLPLGHNDEDLEPESRRSRRSYSTRSVKSTRSLRSVQPG